jgi:hypothetical protein
MYRKDIWVNKNEYPIKNILFSIYPDDIDRKIQLINTILNLENLPTNPRDDVMKLMIIKNLTN